LEKKMNLSRVLLQARKRICVVGSGPAGWYSVESLLSSSTECNIPVHIDVLERLAAPFGLVRYGVAPDHPEMKAVEHKFGELATSKDVRWVGNVGNVDIGSLSRYYDAVVLACGAGGERKLRLDGAESLGGVVSARQFVGWYCGHPDMQDVGDRVADCLRSGDSAVVVGQGNVAVDVARILLRNVDELASTDMTAEALDVLKQSAVRRVHLIGRRGPAQAAFTAKEFREMLRLDGVQVIVRDDEIALNEASRAEIAKSRARKRIYELICKADRELQIDESRRQLHVRFCQSPVALLESGERAGRIGGVRLRANTLVGEPDAQRAVPVDSDADADETIACNALLPSIGYFAQPLPGVPFDAQCGVVPNVRGRVIESSDAPEKTVDRMYVVGWLKRGPSGVIATNRWDAQETAHCILEDFAAARQSERESDDDADFVRDVLIGANKQPVVTWDQWLRIDEMEQRKGTETNKAREKFVNNDRIVEEANK
jgi:adrenodoxin-NADP+ reductase